MPWISTTAGRSPPSDSARGGRAGSARARRVAASAAATPVPPRRSPSCDGRHGRFAAAWTDALYLAGRGLTALPADAARHDRAAAPRRARQPPRPRCPTWLAELPALESLSIGENPLPRHPAAGHRAHAACATSTSTSSALEAVPDALGDLARPAHARPRPQPPRARCPPRSAALTRPRGALPRRQPLRGAAGEPCGSCARSATSARPTTGIGRLPDWIGELEHLIELRLYRNALTALPASTRAARRAARAAPGPQPHRGAPGRLGELRELRHLACARTR